MEKFKVIYRPRTVIKRQALVDFLVEFTYPEDLAKEAKPFDLLPNLQLTTPTWVFFVDGSLNIYGSGARIILTTPEGIYLEYTFRFGFQASNNEVEYEALLVGLQLATSMGAQQLQVYSDSQLIVN